MSNCISVQTLINQINNSIIELGKQPSNTSYFPNTKGTYNDLQILNKVIYTEGTTGNTSTDGYYASYNVDINQLLNIINFSISESNDYNLCFTRTEQSQKYTLNLTYLSSITANGIYDATAKVYSPSYCDGKVETKCSWSGWRNWDVKCKSWWNSCGWNVPSTYKEAVGFALSSNCGATIDDCTGTTDVEFSYGSKAPTGDYTFVTYVIDGLPTQFSYYIYNFKIESLDIYFSKYTINISGLGKNQNTIISSFTASDVQSAIQKYLVPIILNSTNNAIKNICVVLTGGGINP